MLTNHLHQTPHYHHLAPSPHPHPHPHSGFHPSSGVSHVPQHPHLHHSTTTPHHHFQQQGNQLLHQSDSSLSATSTAAAVQTSSTLLSSSSSSSSSGWDRHQQMSSLSDVVTVSAVPHAATPSCTQSSAPPPTQQQQQQECAGCHRPISERYLLRAVDRFWHEDCLKCSCCDCRLGEVGSTLFAKANLLLCRRDYLRLFGATGYCSACSKMIPAFEMVMKAKENVYHLECFACQQCNHRFCIGDRYYLCDNKILCQFDYEERMAFARLSHGYGVMSQMKRQVGSSTSVSCRSPTPHL